MAAAARPHPFRDRVREKIIERCMARGATRAQVVAVLADMESDRPLLDWLANGGLEAIIKLIMELIALFA